ncbi:rod shape-determining protein MreC [Allopontixanthobacter sp.]|uniref:rod shape-determining protein MreC n=1 Tax=Allopontixanthobacter sp. TaxID=2906452 RepID=UPI002ABD08DD|nr:rod shape-determining protein MreC [Allopontixanthobacter sp.]MDZ4307328.1 rod shape-determining protein MreC [Allopontixanthobacter sp.]
MAPPSKRRPGFSRRAQYGIFTGYVVAGIGALVGAVLLGLSLWRPANFNGPRMIAADAVAPVGEVSAQTRTTGNGLIESITGYYRAGSQNAELKREMELARIRLAEAKAVEQENKRLKALLALQEAEVEPVVVSRIVGSTAASTRRFAYLGAGSSRGVTAGMPVRGPRGVVGRVLEVGRNSSRILLLTDSQSVLPVRRAQDNVVALAEGRGDGLLRIRLINLGINPLKIGDVFVTSGSGGYYRPGVAVAVVSQLTDDGALARIISDPAATDFVSVDPIWQPEAIIGAATPIEEELSE